jgi:hypothetical protein
MSQPSMSPTDRQLQAIADVERIAEEWYESYQARSLLLRTLTIAWRDLDPRVRLLMCATVKELLERNVIQVGHRPKVERPLVGQMEIGDVVDRDV